MCHKCENMLKKSAKCVRLAEFLAHFRFGTLFALIYVTAVKQIKPYIYSILNWRVLYVWHGFCSIVSVSVLWLIDTKRRYGRPYRVRYKICLTL